MVYENKPRNNKIVQNSSREADSNWGFHEISAFYGTPRYYHVQKNLPLDPRRAT
jgi:hypothetical protein